MNIDTLKQALRKLQEDEGVEVPDRVFGVIDQVYYQESNEQKQ